MHTMNPPNAPDLKTLGERLKYAREKAKLSQTSLAKLATCSRQYVVGIEHGRHKEIGSELIIRLADTLSVPIRWLVTGDPLTTYVRLNRDEETLLRAYRRLTPALRKHFQASVSSLVAIEPSVADPFPAATPPKPLPKR